MVFFDEGSGVGTSVGPPWISTTDFFDFFFVAGDASASLDKRRLLSFFSASISSKSWSLGNFRDILSPFYINR